ncbi:MAG TPA: MmgE/PrpD family protein [Solirubrobacteraceae bacterium]|jgi:2-methylcitrate dehydratase PrpD|nr:MmgE/PrpD family protein [Solirubrobacteraceae bacterium]
MAALAVGATETHLASTRGPLLAQLIDAADAVYDPTKVRRAGGRARFDYLACRTAGMRDAPAAVGPAGAAVLGDLDDIHWPSVTHLGAIVWTAVEQAGAMGDQVWYAAHMGYEVAARIGAALGAEHRRYWHATSTAGTVGAAVAAAAASGADPVTAAGHAISVTGGSILCILERTGTRVLHRDHAVAAGIRCARLSDLPAAVDSLEHPRGFFAAMGGAPGSLLESRASTALEEVSFRAHPTSGFNQAAVEAAQELGPVADGDDIAALELDVPEATAALAGIAEPKDLEEAWWSCQHAVAVTLLGLDLAICPVDDPAVARLRSRVKLRGGSSVTRLTLDGRMVERDRAAELSDADLVAKWRRLNPEVEPPMELLS